MDFNSFFTTAVNAAIAEAVAAALAPFEARLAALEAKSDADTAGIVSLLDVTSRQFIDAVEEIATRVAEDKCDDHTRTYEHDDYDEAVRKLDDLDDLDEKVTKALKEVLTNAAEDL